jgi:hypothetical protein
MYIVHTRVALNEDRGLSLFSLSLFNSISLNKWFHREIIAQWGTYLKNCTPAVE